MRLSEPKGAEPAAPSPILLVEDDPDLRELLEEFLLSEGYPVVSASDGQRAIRLLRDGLRPFIILLDVMMPGANGYDFRHEQLKDPELANIPVAIVTAVGHTSDRIRKEFGDVEVVMKPVDTDRMLAIIHRAAGRDAGQGCGSRTGQTGREPIPKIR